MASAQPLVSVIIPFYNCGYVNQAIESALRQTYGQTEIIVVNDGSTEFTHLVKPYLTNITYIEQVNQGVAAALNTGIKHANGDYIVWLSSDDLFDDRKVELQLEFMQNKQSMLSFTNFNLIDDNNIITKYNVGNNFTSYLEILQTLKSYNPINGCTVMMTKTAIQKVGSFDESLKYAQDYDFWIRTALEFSIDYLELTLTNYRIHQQMGSIQHHQKQMQEFHQVRAKYRQDINRLIALKRNERNA
ncbi:glycosyltransferase family 2 protein [Bacillus rubiinfantis]|uniref:glycosyltransferase family 2 protein n=1 Tax=Bacillus rubiinfantis TaxID=1499680 RepID=UPI0005A86448|nr:glycosyltransferase [Bacillus rubiinfantis]